MLQRSLMSVLGAGLLTLLTLHAAPAQAGIFGNRTWGEPANRPYYGCRFGTFRGYDRGDNHGRPGFYNGTDDYRNGYGSYGMYGYGRPMGNGYANYYGW